MNSSTSLESTSDFVDDDIGETTAPCPKHAGQLILYHCPKHSLLGCHICFFQHQKRCRAMRYIPEESKKIVDSGSLREFMAKLNVITDRSKMIVLESEHKITIMEKCHTEAVSAIKAIKTELLEVINHLEQELYEKAEKFKSEEINKLQPVIDSCLQIQTANQAIAANIKELQNKTLTGDLYISMVSSREKLLSLENELHTVKSGNTVKPFIFVTNTEIRETLNSSRGLGNLRITQITRAEHVKDIMVKHGCDNHPCLVSGSVLMPKHKLVIADYYNNSVKVVDSKQQTTLSEITLSSGPWALAKVTDNTVAATLPCENKIVFIRTEPTLVVDMEIRVDGSCHGVAYTDEKFVVGFHGAPDKVEIMDMKGSVLCSIKTDSNGQVLFHDPYHVAVNPKLSLIYVSNCSSHKVVCLKFDGTVVATYTDNKLQKPLQVLVDSSGKVYVCARDSGNVHQMTAECKKIKVLLTRDDGLGRPYTISYDETEERLYVGQHNNNRVKVYQLICETL